MKQPDTPADEPGRLATLHALNVLDTAAEERFDRLTRMAKRIFDVPIALVSLVDAERQWFKSCIGLDASETPRSISFCGHAILDSETFVVTDASADPRFADNPLVTGEPHIRFYAGCPLKAPNGMKIGTLCIIDRQPRTLSDDDATTLADLAAMVERELAVIQLATLDELTGISNRRGFMLLGQYGLNFCAREDVPASLVFFDLDRFKSINDRFGHAEGDRVLAFFADQLQHTFRESDLPARLGGDEFVALLINSTSERTEQIVARLVDAIDTHNRDANNGYDIEFSHGLVALDPLRHPSIDALLADGDALMYQIKHDKR